MKVFLSIYCLYALIAETKCRIFSSQHIVRNRKGYPFTVNVLNDDVTPTFLPSR